MTGHEIINNWRGWLHFEQSEKKPCHYLDMKILITGGAGFIHNGFAVAVKTSPRKILL